MRRTDMPPSSAGRSRQSALKIAGLRGLSAFGTWSVVLALLIGFTAPANAYEESESHDASRSTHQWLFDQVVELLATDGFEALASFVRDNLPTLKSGSILADRTLLDSREHYMDPFTGRGLAGFRSAGDLASDKVLAAKAEWAAREYWNALRNLGWTLHLIQDMTVPHHARLAVLDFHADYEAAVSLNLGRIAVPATGIYSVPGLVSIDDPTPWLEFAGRASYGWFPRVDGPDGQGDNNYSAAANALVPLAIQLSAGFLYAALSSLSPEAPTASPVVPQSGVVGVPVEMSCNACKDDGPLATISWEFGDGTLAEGRRVDHSYNAPGTYAARCIVTDAIGYRTVVSSQLTVYGSPLTVPFVPGIHLLLLAVLVLSGLVIGWTFLFRNRRK